MKAEPKGTPANRHFAGALSLLVRDLNRSGLGAREASSIKQAVVQTITFLMSVRFAEREAIVAERLPQFEATLRQDHSHSGWQLLCNLIGQTRGTTLGKSPGLSQLVDELEATGAQMDKSLSRLGHDSPLSKALLIHVVEEVRLTVPGEDCVAQVQAIGEAYENLLGVKLWQLPGPALLLRPHGIWILLHDLIKVARRERAQWLHAQAGIGKGKARQLTQKLADADSLNQLQLALEAVRDGNDGQGIAGQWVLQPSLERRRSGSHYTPRSLARVLVERAISPLLQPEKQAEALLQLRICDPAMGSGMLLCSCCDLLAQKLASRSRVAQGQDPRKWRRRVAASCLYGVDSNPAAVMIARLTLTLLSVTPEQPAPELKLRLLAGNAVVGPTFFSSPDSGASAEKPLETAASLNWAAAFPELRARGGFDAVVGNPPWVAYAGRAAQPISQRLSDYFKRSSSAFAGYRTLHGVFIHRSAQLLREGGRLGLLLPTSVADLKGYAATRLAHDQLCTPDPELPDFGDGRFPGVFQPCMALLSTRRRQPGVVLQREWDLQRNDLSSAGRALLARLSSGPRLPEPLFGERGYQTRGNDPAELRADGAPPLVPIREGTDITEFCSLRPRLWVDPRRLEGRFRPRHEWEQVRLLIRQTARFPIAALADGLAFRNSILAGFDAEGFSADFLLGYLNSQTIRWYHFMRHRDARQGMPQLKIGHLRNLPRPSAASDTWFRDLSRLAQDVRSSAGGDPKQRERLETVVALGLGLSSTERALVKRWAAQNPLPRSRR